MCIRDSDGTELCYVDNDLDRFRSDTTVSALDISCRDPGLALATADIDCDDSDAAINPNAAELVGDNVDQNCDGAEVCYQDSDRDDYRAITTVNSVDTDCNDAGEALASASIDCDDTDASIRPDAVEGIGDEVDQNCDGREICYRDSDRDSYRTNSTVSSVDTDCRCLLYTSPSPRDKRQSRMPSSA